MNTVEAKKGFRTFVILSGILGLTLGLYRTLPGLITSAKSSEKPQNIHVAAVQATAVTITWETEVETRGFVVYGISPSKLVRTAPEMQKTKNHQVIIENLRPNTTYYYKVGSNEREYGKEPLRFTTTGD